MSPQSHSVIKCHTHMHITHEYINCETENIYNVMHACSNYSETSDSGPSEKGTPYYKPLYRGQFMGP